MNIVMVIIDTLRYDHIAASSGLEIHTPNFDRLVAKSWNFHRAFAASFPTIPHRTDTMTGRYGAPFHPWKPLDCDVPTIPRALAEVGYCSQLIHDTPHLVNGGNRFDYPFDAWTPVRGAEVDRAWITDTWEFFDNWTFDPLFDDYPMTKKEVLRGHHAICCYTQTNHGRRNEEDWNVAKLFSKASNFLRDNTSRDKFLLWIDCFDPHEPWDAPPEFMKMYDKTPGYDGSIDPRAFHVRNDPNLPEAARERVKAMYKAKVSFLDKQFGRFLDTLEETGLAENTAILLTSDHGTNVGDRGNFHFGKMAPPKENESHVPFIVHAPGMGSGDSQVLVQPQDVFATVMGIAGNEALTPDSIESYNVLAQLDEGTEGKRKLALAGRSVDRWEGLGPEEVLFSVFDQEWRLGIAPDIEHCELQPVGSLDVVTSEYPEVVEQLYAAGIAEIARRGLDPALVAWLESGGTIEFPETYQATDAHPAPPGWRGSYWNNMVNRFGVEVDLDR
jgi:arylsulfatase A-like enzyme